MRGNRGAGEKETELTVENAGGVEIPRDRREQRDRRKA